MKKLILVLCATVALAAPAAASAHHRHGEHHRFGVRLTAVEHGLKLGWWKHGALFAKLTGTGTSFGLTSASASGTLVGRPLASGTFTSSIATDWSKATANRFGGQCAPATATLSLVDSASSANAVGSNVTGKTCSVGTNGWDVAYVFVGRSSVSSATGTLSTVSGSGRVLLAEKTDGTVKGFVWTGLHGDRAKTFTTYTKRDADDSCHCRCDGH
jgi:hypothetical protein